MTEPQVWTLIGVFAAGMMGTLTLISTLFVRVIRSEIAGLRGELLGEIGGLRGELGGEIGALRSEMKGEIGVLRSEMKGEIGALRGEMNARFQSLEDRFTYLDRDVNLLMRREFPETP